MLVPFVSIQVGACNLKIESGVAFRELQRAALNATDTVLTFPERSGLLSMGAIQATQFGFEMPAKRAVHGRLYRQWKAARIIESRRLKATKLPARSGALTAVARGGGKLHLWRGIRVP